MLPDISAIMMVGMTVFILMNYGQIQLAQVAVSITDPDSDRVTDTETGQRKAPIAISGDNVYVSWWTNNTDNKNEVIFRSSTDGGTTFEDKINLSNTNDTDSIDVEISAERNNVIVSWWEADIPVMRVSNDNGVTFGPILVLATNGSIGQAETTN